MVAEFHSPMADGFVSGKDETLLLLGNHKT